MYLFHIVDAVAGMSNTLTESMIDNKNHLSSIQNNHKIPYLPMYKPWAYTRTQGFLVGLYKGGAYTQGGLYMGKYGIQSKQKNYFVVILYG